MPTITLSSGQSFQAEPGISILAAAEAAGIHLPYSCKSGRCSACKCKPTQGETETQNDETGLSDQEKADGWILSCVRSATTDLSLTVEGLLTAPLPPVQTLPCRISTLERVTPEILKVVLRLPPSANFAFLAGQYIDVAGPNGTKRSYSIANAPANNTTIELHIRRQAGGVMSKYWFEQAKENDLLRLNGPLGSFCLQSVGDMDLIFLATGTGIAPVKAMLAALDAASAEQQPKSITLLWGARIEEDLYLKPASKHENFKYIPVLSRADDTWQGARGHVQNVLLSKLTSFKNAAVYACGSSAMIADAHSALLAAKLNPHRFHSDAFVQSGTN